MKRLVNPITGAGLAVLIGGFALGQPLAGFAGLVIMLFGLAVGFSTRLRDGTFDEIERGVTPTFRSELAPIRAHRRKIAEWVGANPNDTIAKVLGAEAIMEAAHLHQAAADVQRLRHKLLATGAKELEPRLDELEAMVRQAGEDVEKLYHELVAGSVDSAPEEGLRERLSSLQAISRSLEEAGSLDGLQLKP